MKKLKEFENWLAILFDYDEDKVVLNFDDKELYKEFCKQDILSITFLEELETVYTYHRCRQVLIVNYGYTDSTLPKITDNAIFSYCISKGYATIANY